jgi:predicted short-subunit dehydrogenase-like oxidoreductase (DUF2520 family)
MAAERKGTQQAARPARRRQQQPRLEPKPGISIIGAGRLGTALAIALASRGYSIEAVVARRLRQARRSAALVSSGPRALTGKQLRLLPSSDLIFITTPDDAIEETAAQLLAASTPETDHRGRTVLHTSGARSSNVLSCLRDAGFCVGSLHPLVSVSDAVSGAESLQKAFYCVEGGHAAVRLACSLVRDLGGQSFSIDAHDKALYHAAAVMASGHVVALFDIAIEMLLRCGLTRARARAVLLPLLRSTVANLSAHEPARALTGTFARADVATVKHHLQALRRQNSRASMAAYTLLGQRSLQLAKMSGAGAAALKEIALALKEDSGKR